MEVAAINRRAFLTGTAASAALIAVPSVALAVPPLIIAVAVKFAEKALESLASSAAGIPSTTDLANAIDTAVRDLKAYILAQEQMTRLAVNTDILRANLSAVNTAITDYANVARKDIPLQSAYEHNTFAIGLAQQMGVPALPAYAISVSQRAFLLKALSGKRDTRSIRAYARQLNGEYIKYLSTSLDDYLASLDTGKRVSDLTCDLPRPDTDRQRNAGGFHTKPPHMQCFMLVDGNREELSNGDVFDGDQWDTIYGISQRVYGARKQGIAQFKSQAQSEFVDPLKGIIKDWQATVAKAAHL